MTDLQLKTDVPAINFARAYEAVLPAASKDKRNQITYRTVGVEYFEGDGLRLVSSDGYIVARAWVGFDDDNGEYSPEPDLEAVPDAQFIVSDVDLRGLDMVKHARTSLDSLWRFKAKHDEPDFRPTLRLQLREPDVDQGALPGMQMPLFEIDYHDHETVALTVIDADFVNWRQFLDSNDSWPAKGVDLNADQFIVLGKIAKLYDSYPIEFTFHEEPIVTVEVGPVLCAVKTAGAVAAAEAKRQAEIAQAELEDEQAAYDEDDDQ